jgi:hypothetical protein
MGLGSQIFSGSRIKPNQISVFAKWDSESAIDEFLQNSDLGRILNGGWHVRLRFLRRWGHVDEFNGLPEMAVQVGEDSPVVAVTLARMKLLQIPRFIHWGRPVESLVRDHPAVTLAIAAIRPPKTVSTFSIWKTQREMVQMVRGHSSVSEPNRHAAAMKERQRKDFHSQFTTLRFQPLSEFGEWKGKAGDVPGLDSGSKVT